jgi:hypothetical protein
MRWGIILIFVAALVASIVPLDSREAHKKADAIYYPLLIAAMNEYGLNHGGPNDPGHLDKIAAKDLRNIHSVREAYKNWNDAMKQAGY